MLAEDDCQTIERARRNLSILFEKYRPLKAKAKR
jgi:hypothetical protein